MCKPLVEFSEECLTSKLLFWVGEGERDELHHRYSKMFNIYPLNLRMFTYIFMSIIVIKGTKFICNFYSLVSDSLRHLLRKIRWQNYLSKHDLRKGLE